MVVSTSDYHPRGLWFDSRLYPRNFSGSIGSGTGSTQPREDNWVTTWMRSSEIRLRKLKLRLRDKLFTNHKAPCTVIWQNEFILQPFRHFTYVTTHSPTLLSLYLRHSSWAELILQPFRHFTYVTTHSPTLPSLHLRHSSFSNPSFSSRTSQALHLRHLASRPWIKDQSVPKFIGRR